MCVREGQPSSVSLVSDAGSALTTVLLNSLLRMTAQ